MDARSQTLRVVRLVGAIVLHGRFTAPGCHQSPHADAAAPLLEPTAGRVQQLVGPSPMQHLAQWRRLLATHLLARIADEVGDPSGTACSRAFRREFGALPRAGRASGQSVKS